MTRRITTNPLFDAFFNLNASDRPDNFPRSNIIKVDDDNYILEFAVAGFSKDDIVVTYHDNTLSINGRFAKEKYTDRLEYVQKGITTKPFQKDIKISANWEPSDITLSDGILTINLTKIAPEVPEPKVLTINTK